MCMVYSTIILICIYIHLFIKLCIHKCYTHNTRIIVMSFSRRMANVAIDITECIYRVSTTVVNILGLIIRAPQLHYLVLIDEDNGERNVITR